jgi:hypothetical protein
MQYSLAHQLGKRSGALDPDAKAYIASVETAGATVTSGQKKAINTFVKAGKSDGWYSSIKRLYLPIWASAAPNAIDMIELGSGTFNGTVTHSSGYVQGDGTSGYFLMDDDLPSLGLTSSSASAFWGCKGKPSVNNRVHMGAASGDPISAYFIAFRHDTSTNGEMSVNGFSNAATGANNNGFADSNIGCWVSSRTTSTGHDLYKHGDVTVGSTVSATGAIPTVKMACMARNLRDSFDVFSNGEYFMFGIGLGLDATKAKSLANNMKTLWETSTGLTLP